MQLTTKRLLLRELREADIPLIAEYANNIKVSANLAVVPHPYTRKHAQQFVAAAKKQRGAKRTEYHFAICWKKDKQFMGVIGVHKVNKIQGNATIGYWLGEPHWGQGIMTEAVARAIQFCFTTLKLRRIDISVLPHNTASKRVIEKAGFTFEGTRRKRLRPLATKKVDDELIYGLLKDQWQKA